MKKKQIKTKRQKMNPGQTRDTIEIKKKNKNVTKMRQKRDKNEDKMKTKIQLKISP